MKHVVIAFALLVCAITQASLCAAQSCEVLKDANGQQRRNGSQLCVTLKITNGALDVDRSQSKFVASDEFRRRLSIPFADAEQIVFTTLGNVLKPIPKPYRLALSDEDKTRDDKGELNDAQKQMRSAPLMQAGLTISNSMTTGHRRPTGKACKTCFQIFNRMRSTPLENAPDTTALLVWEDNSLMRNKGRST